MLKLCRKDAAASIWLWLLVLLIFALYGLNPLNPIWILIPMGVALVFALLLVTLALEDRFRTETLVCSLPVKRSTVVAARYLFGGLLIVFALLAASGYILLLQSSKLWGKVKVTPLTVEAVLIFVLLMVFLLCLFLPFYFRLGLGKALFGFSLTLLALLAAGGGLLQVVFTLATGRRLFFASRFLAAPLPTLTEALRDLVHALGLPLFLPLLLALVTLTVFLSLCCSIRFYRRRDF